MVECRARLSVSRFRRQISMVSCHRVGSVGRLARSLVIGLVP